MDIMSRAKRSRLMSRIRGKGTTPERYISRALEASGLSLRYNDKTLPGCPDVVVPAARLVIFINGDFWHGWRFPRWRHRLGSFWRAKIMTNRLRDVRNQRKLKRAGWKVIRIWEHE